MRKTEETVSSLKKELKATEKHLTNLITAVEQYAVSIKTYLVGLQGLTTQLEYWSKAETENDILNAITGEPAVPIPPLGDDSVPNVLCQAKEMTSIEESAWEDFPTAIECIVLESLRYELLMIQELLTMVGVYETKTRDIASDQKRLTSLETARNKEKYLAEIDTINLELEKKTNSCNRYIQTFLQITVPLVSRQRSKTVKGIIGTLAAYSSKTAENMREAQNPLVENIRISLNAVYGDIRATIDNLNTA